jgi:hypothetical protein
MVKCDDWWLKPWNMRWVVPVKIHHEMMSHSMTLWSSPIWIDVLSCLKSYLLNRSFSVYIERFKSSSYTNFYNNGVPQLLLVLLYSFYTLLLLTKSFLIHLQIINSSLTILNSIYHTLLLTSHTLLLTLTKTVSIVYNWMPSNFNPLIPSKTEFLVTGVPVSSHFA